MNPWICTHSGIAFDLLELDGDDLTHVWWVPPWFLGTGTLLEAALPPGAYRVYLTSIDPSGRSDSTALHHVRSCK